jgi:hypothetical protein
MIKPPTCNKQRSVYGEVEIKGRVGYVCFHSARFILTSFSLILKLNSERRMLTVQL